MQFDDAPFGIPFPVRDKSSIGKWGERNMLDRVGGSATIRKDFSTGVDGVVTMLATRAGFPEFSSKPTQTSALNRTFVFNVHGEKTGVVANRGESRIKVIGKVAVDTTGYSICSVVAHHTNNWFDIARIDGNTPTYNAAPTHELVGAISQRARPPMFFSVKKSVSAVANTYGGNWSVSAFDALGHHVNSITSVTGEYYNADHAAGISVTPLGEFSLYWFAAPKIDTYQWWHRTIRVTAEGVVGQTGNTGSADVKVSPEVTGSTYEKVYSYTYDRPLYERKRVVGYVDIIATGGYVYQRPIIGTYADGSTTLSGKHVVRFENKSVGFSKTNALYTNTPVELILSMSVAGNENSVNTYNIGSAQSNPIKVQRDVNQRSTTASVLLTSSFGGTLFGYEFTNTLVTDKPNPPCPNLVFKHVDGESVYPYQTFDIGHGEWCYLHETPTAVATCFAALDKQNAYRTEQLALSIAQYNDANINASLTGPFNEGFKDSSPSHYYDTTAITITSRDYVYADIDEGVFIYLETTAERAIYIEDLKQTLAMLAGGNAAADSDIHSFHAKFVFSFRGADFVFGEVGPVNTHPSGVMPNPVGTEYVFSQVPRVPTPVPVFCPPYTQQGNCPYIAYTTRDEEAAGATPEVYVDFSVLPVFEAMNDVEGVVQFPAYQASLSYGLMAQTPDVWLNELFPKPTRIQFCNGAEGPWQMQLGKGFEAHSVQVEITRI